MATLRNVICMAVGLVLIMPDFCSAQSGSFVVGTPAKNYSVPNSLNSQQRRWEQILDQPALGKFGNVESCQDLLVVLRKLGLPVVLTNSAKEDLLTEDELIRIEFDGMSIRGVLDSLFVEYNAAMVFDTNKILIISLDNSWDGDYLRTVVYDVSQVTFNSTSTQRLSDTITGTIDNDSWDFSTGLGISYPSSIGRRRLLTVTQTYKTHRKIQQYLLALNRLKGRPVEFETQLRPSSTGSKIVYSRSNPAPTNRRGGFGGSIGGFGGGGFGGSGAGVGGYGLGGGVF